jgi:hypothetical protein
MEDLRLLPADMPAVIKRTNLKPNIDNLLLPIFEAISNSIHSISDLESEDAGAIEIEIFTNDFQVTIKDNGVGLNKDNMDAFLTPFTGNKLRKGGKGFGRFIGFKVFRDIHYFSRFTDVDGAKELSFRFDIFSDSELTGVDTPVCALNYETGTCVKLEGLLEDFQKVSENIDSDDIVDHIIRYFLPYFVSGRLPKLDIFIDGNRHDPLERFGEIFQSDNVSVEKIEIGGVLHDFEIGITMSKKGSVFSEACSSFICR